MMFRVEQFLASSARLVSIPPVTRWKPLWSSRFSFSSIVAQSTSSKAAEPQMGKIKFCQWCGGPMKHVVPDGDERVRAICTICSKIAYQNPKMYVLNGWRVQAKTPNDEECWASLLEKGDCSAYFFRRGSVTLCGIKVVGCLVEHDNKVLLCKRNIPPSHGRWTLPAGFMEIGESAAEGAMRETREEAGAKVEIISHFAHLDIPRIGQSYIIFRARLEKPEFSPGAESMECQLFKLEDIPFDSLAFSSMLVTLNLYVQDIKSGNLKFHFGIINKREGTGPLDIHAYTLDSHLTSDDSLCHSFFVNYET